MPWSARAVGWCNIRCGALPPEQVRGKFAPTPLYSPTLSL
jgi:hypothetical protein